MTVSGGVGRTSSWTSTAGVTTGCAVGIMKGDITAWLETKLTRYSSVVTSITVHGDGLAPAASASGRRFNGTCRDSSVTQHVGDLSVLQPVYSVAQYPIGLVDPLTPLTTPVPIILVPSFPSRIPMQYGALLWVARPSCQVLMLVLLNIYDQSFFIVNS